jgi:hypothetical protein
VSDSETELAAAAMDVLVGSWSNPDNLAGLAHFCGLELLVYQLIFQNTCYLWEQRSSQMKTVMENI